MRHNNEDAATSAEITIGGIILFVNIFADLVLYFCADVMLSPLLDLLAGWNIHPALKESLWELTYISYAPFAFMLLFAVMSIVAFVMILARRQVSPFDY